MQTLPRHDNIVIYGDRLRLRQVLSNVIRWRARQRASPDHDARGCRASAHAAQQRVQVRAGADGHRGVPGGDRAVGLRRATAAAAAGPAAGAARARPQQRHFAAGRADRRADGDVWRFTVGGRGPRGPAQAHARGHAAPAARADGKSRHPPARVVQARHEHPVRMRKHSPPAATSRSCRCALTHARTQRQWRGDCAERYEEAVPGTREADAHGHGRVLTGADAVAVAQAFQQFRSGTLQEGGGSGLGLSIGRQIVELHGMLFRIGHLSARTHSLRRCRRGRACAGGEILVESKEGYGSTFSVVLPVLRCPPGVSPPPAVGFGAGAPRAPAAGPGPATLPNQLHGPAGTAATAPPAEGAAVPHTLPNPRGHGAPTDPRPGRGASGAQPSATQAKNSPPTSSCEPLGAPAIPAAGGSDVAPASSPASLAAMPAGGAPPALDPLGIGERCCLRTRLCGGSRLPRP
jgi:hypothetical protein